MFKLGYNTNGFTSHGLLDAIDIIGSFGYESVAITIDHHALNPFDPNLDSQVARVKSKLVQSGLSCMIETGARFLLNPRIKHEPTLISPDHQQRHTRIQFIENCIRVAADLNADAVSIWSGIKHGDIETSQAWEWLISGCQQISKTAAEHDIYIGFEPEPGMMVETLSQYQTLKQAVDHDHFKLTLDIGHALITEESVNTSIQRLKNDIVNIHLEDMRKNKHDHLFFGQGELNFPTIFQSLEDIGYIGQVNIELSRHSHDAVNTSKNAIAFVNDIKK